MKMKVFNRFIGLLLSVCLLNFFPNMIAMASGEVKITLEMGDINGDGEILTEDARIALGYSINILDLTEEQISRADMNSDGVIDTSDVISILELCADLSVEYLPEISHITPYSKHNSSAQYQYCKAIGGYTETFSLTVEGDRSSPLYSALPEGTFDRVVKTDGDFVYLSSGRKTYKDEVEVFKGYEMPYNYIHHQDIVDYTENSTDLYFAMDWKVPFNVTLSPQSYEVGYSGREFNLVNDNFTAEYMDITFYNTPNADGNIHNYFDSDVIESSKWIIDSSAKTSTLRVYLKEEGSFYGYKAYYNDKNYLVISVKEKPVALQGLVIELDPGHGGDDPGACSGGLYECNVAYDIAQELEKLLVAQGARVVFSYDENVEPVPEIVDRRLTAMAENPDMYISIHLNSSTSSSAVGSSVYYYKNYSSDLSKSISRALASAVKNGTGYTLQNDGSHYYPFRVTRIENCPSVLVECGYISNYSERNMMNSSAGKKALAQGIYNGIVNYINAQ